MTPDSVHREPIKTIRPGKNSVKEYIAEVWHYRNLILVLTKQEFKVQYVQTRFNLLWAVLRPLFVLAIFTFIFDRMIHIPGLQYPYPLFAISGLIIWNNFSFMVNNAGSVIISNQQLIKKYYFPRIILIFSKTLIGLIEVGITFLLMVILMLIWQHPIPLQVIFAPVFVVLGLVSGMGLAIWLNALTIKFRDLHQFVPTLIGFLIWLTPVFYPATLIPSDFSFVAFFNPIAGVIQGFRWTVLGDPFPSIWYLPSFVVSLGMLFSGFLIFIRSEAELVDYI
jgi:lipopolysaccharide transport system permease protein